MALVLDDTELRAGDDFHLHFSIFNPLHDRFTCDTYILLGIHGMYWCWPSWQEVTAGLDMVTYSVDAASILEDAVLQFTWPAGVGQGSGLEFIGAVFTPGTFEMIGDLQYITWRYY